MLLKHTLTDLLVYSSLLPSCPVVLAKPIDKSFRDSVQYIKLLLDFYTDSLEFGFLGAC